MCPESAQKGCTAAPLQTLSFAGVDRKGVKQSRNDATTQRC